MGDISVLDQAVATAPKSYVVIGSQELIVRAVSASFDGSSAAGSFVPALQFVDPSGFVVGTYPAGSTLTAGASADVSWFPIGGLTTTTSGGGGTRTLPFQVTTPDATGNGYPYVTTQNTWTNVRRVLPGFTHGVDGTWEGSLVIPIDYASGGTITLAWAANATTGNLRNRVGTQVVANATSLDGAYTQETYVNTAAAGTAKQQFSSSFVLSTLLAAGSTLLVQITRNGASASDTLTVDAVLFAAALTYTSSH